MSGLRLGDYILDPRGLLFLPSLSALVVSDLKQALGHKNSVVVKEVASRVDVAVHKYKPEVLIILGSLEDDTALSAIAKKWGTKLRVVLVASSPQKEAKAVAEALKFEVHKELVWDRYRFLEYFENPPFADSKDLQAMDFQFLTIAGRSDFFVRIGQLPIDPFHMFSGEKLGVFLRGMGRLKLPSMDSAKGLRSIFSRAVDPFFARYDVFAMGHSRILPLGKVTDLKRHATLDSLPVSKRALKGGKSTKVKKTAADPAQTDLFN